MSSYFLALSREVQLMIIEYTTRPTDLKALCLVSKELLAISTPALYRQVDLTPQEITSDEDFSNSNPISSLQVNRLKSLLQNKNNLSFIRVLITSKCDIFLSSLLDELLENLRENQLVELHYGKRGLTAAHYNENCFPNMEQMKRIWTHQRRLQTLHSTHLLTFFEAFLENELDYNAILKPVKELILIEKLFGSQKLDLVTWPIVMVNTSSLQKLKLVEWDLEKNIQKLDKFFADNAFVNLTELYFEDIIFDTPLQLTNCPLLQSLTIVNCQTSPQGPAMLSIPNTLKIASLHYVGGHDFHDYELLVPILSRIQGLEQLVLEIISPGDEDITEELMDKFHAELAFALEMQQGTLTELVVREISIHFCCSRLVFGGEELFRVVQGCLGLRRLALPLSSEDLVPRYIRLMQDLPHLAYYWLSWWDYYYDDGDGEIATQFENAILETNLLFFAHEHSCYSRQMRRNDEPAGKPEPHANTEGSDFAQIDWTAANPLFYNRYPSLPLLPANGAPEE